jgi:indolepyruvate ferredoxin oxidoreductase beta subunit
MAESRVALLLVGVGGQGVLTASQILGDAAHAAGIPVVVGQLHGMSQRGGSVECSVLLGPGQSSFLSVADIVVGFEPLETMRARKRMCPETKVLVSEGRIMLSDLGRTGMPYPPREEMLREIRTASSTVVVVDGPAAVEQIGEARSLNVVLLGALAGLGWLAFDETVLWHAVARRCRPRYRDANRRAFDLGRTIVLDAPPGGGARSRRAEPGRADD